MNFLTHKKQKNSFQKKFSFFRLNFFPVFFPRRIKNRQLNGRPLARCQKGQKWGNFLLFFLNFYEILRHHLFTFFLSRHLFSRKNGRPGLLLLDIRLGCENFLISLTFFYTRCCCCCCCCCFYMGSTVPKIISIKTVTLINSN